jgi:hypothetical protein
MKLSKIFLLAGAVLAFASCSEKEEWNTSEGALVGMANPTLVISEAKGLFNLPISVTGERNAEVQVTVEVTPVEETDKVVTATEDVNYIVTSKVIKVPADKTTGNIEVMTVDDAEINNARQFVVTVVSVEGATIDESGNIIPLSASIPEDSESSDSSTDENINKNNSILLPILLDLDFNYRFHYFSFLFM